MSIFKNIFGSNEKDIKQPTEFSEGDVFYTILDGEIHLEKLLKFDREFDTYHILSYRPVKTLPAKNGLQNLQIFAHHAPINKNGFENPKLFAHTTVSAADLSGYHEYLRQTADNKEIVSIAHDYFLEGNRLADEKKFEESIDEFSKAVDLFPQFYEAIENRAFSKMDLRRLDEAIEDFNLSLEVFPESLSAIFSVGECYLKMGKIGEAEKYFRRALEIDPDHQVSDNFLQYMIELKKRGLKDEESPDKIAVHLREIMHG